MLASEVRKAEGVDDKAALKGGHPLNGPQDRRKAKHRVVSRDERGCNRSGASRNKAAMMVHQGAARTLVDKKPTEQRQQFRYSFEGIIDNRCNLNLIFSSLCYTQTGREDEKAFKDVKGLTLFALRVGLASKPYSRSRHKRQIYL